MAQAPAGGCLVVVVVGSPILIRPVPVVAAAAQDSLGAVAAAQPQVQPQLLVVGVVVAQVMTVADPPRLAAARHQETRVILT